LSRVDEPAGAAVARAETQAIAASRAAE